MSGGYGFSERHDGSNSIVPVGNVEAIAAMNYPMRCRWCHQIHDAAKVDVVQRYSDCSTWRCPNCGVLIDDRPRAWGGSAEAVDQNGNPR